MLFNSFSYRDIPRDIMLNIHTHSHDLMKPPASFHFLKFHFFFDISKKVLTPSQAVLKLLGISENILKSMKTIPGLFIFVFPLLPVADVLVHVQRCHVEFDATIEMSIEKGRR